MMIEIDSRTLACPTPVTLTMRALAESRGAPVTVLADLGPSRENIIRMAQTKGFSVEEEFCDGYCRITLVRKASASDTDHNFKDGQTVFLIASDRLGDGADELGRLLMKNLIITLLETEQLPDRMFFINSGVLLVIENSELVVPLQGLAVKGVEILSCGVCLDYYAVREQLAVGQITNMFTIAEAMLASANTIRI